MQPQTISCAELDAALALVPDITAQAQTFEDARRLTTVHIQVNHVQFETMGKLRLTGETEGLL